jgi:hypothetical protein
VRERVAGADLGPAAGDERARADPKRAASIACANKAGACFIVSAPDNCSTAGVTNLKRVGGVAKADTPPCSRNRLRRSLRRQPQQLAWCLLCCGAIWHWWNALPLTKTRLSWTRFFESERLLNNQSVLRPSVCAATEIMKCCGRHVVRCTLESFGL